MQPEHYDEHGDRVGQSGERITGLGLAIETVSDDRAGPSPAATSHVPASIAATLGVVSAGVGLGAGHLVAGLFRSAANPVIPVGQVVIDRVPNSVKDWAIRTFGTADKAVLLVGTILVLLGVGAAAGFAARARRWFGVGAMFAAVGVLGVAAVLARPSPSFSKVLPAIVGVVVSWLSLRLLVRAAEPVNPPEPGRAAIPVRMGVDRRSLLGTGIALAAVGGSAAGVGSWLRRRFDVEAEREAVAQRLDGPATPTPNSGGSSVPPTSTVPPSAVEPTVVGPFDLGVPKSAPFVVPNKDFYRIDTALVVPQVSVQDWTLRVHGMVDRELSLTFDDLLAMPQIERHITLSCVSNPVGGDLIGNALWRGVRVTDVLDRAGVQAGASQLASKSVDGWTCGSPMSVITDGRDAIFALAMNGEPLPADHGYPVRLVVPGLYGYVSATKWVTEVEVTTWDAFDGYWIPRGWSKEGPIKLQSRIDTINKPVAAGAPLVIGGVAWAIHREVSGVELRFDDGDWVPATELGSAPSNDTWKLWRHEWVGAQPGRHTVQVRALAADGEVQTDEFADVAPNGAQGWHKVRVTVPD